MRDFGEEIPGQPSDGADAQQRGCSISSRREADAEKLEFLAFFKSSKGAFNHITGMTDQVYGPRIRLKAKKEKRAGQFLGGIHHQMLLRLPYSIGDGGVNAQQLLNPWLPSSREEGSRKPTEVSLVNTGINRFAPCHARCRFEPFPDSAPVITVLEGVAATTRGIITSHTGHQFPDAFDVGRVAKHGVQHGGSAMSATGYI